MMTIMGQRAKFYNSDLAKLDKQELLDHCPPNVTDAFNIIMYNPTVRKRKNSPLIIVKLSDSIPPDTITISP